MKKRNIFANKENSSFLNLVKVITESIDDETEGLDFEDDAEGIKSRLYCLIEEQRRQSGLNINSIF